MRKYMFKILSVCLFAVVLGICLPVESEAKIAITIKNNRSRTISFAFCWSGFDVGDDRRAGWYNVKAGETKTLTFDAIYALTADGFGYYAKDGKSVWNGNLRQVIVHPTNSFSGHPEGGLQGGQKVGFRKVGITKTDNTNENGKGTMTFNP